MATDVVSHGGEFSLINKSVFISYRRQFSSFTARAIFMELCSHGFDVFMDVESIDSGSFDSIIMNQVAARAHFLVILSPGSVERFQDSNDWLRKEIEYAIDIERNIIPILTDGFTFEQSGSYLTGKINRLSRYNALTVPHEYFDAAMTKLRERYLKQSVHGQIFPTPPTEVPEVQKRIERTIRTLDKESSTREHKSFNLSRVRVLTINLLRVALLVPIPLAVGWMTYTSVTRPQADPPVERRVAHPALPAQFVGLSNPVRKTRDNAMMGKGLYAAFCSTCHGGRFDGQGPAAPGYTPSPTNFTDPSTIAQLSEAYLFWRIKKGGVGLPKESLPWKSAMPRYEVELPDEWIWKIIIGLYDGSGHKPRGPESPSPG